ncbi:hypothetical protein LHYA1_G008173 [Lachnellula hyalina]|uniref:Rhodopsin domain-containing protein n=1 Tax=Lachnellula hyalina TaxID=1316788 RepID=A0A8H8QUB2_9HELO|nr:uncharacterized protein LHYA1_G008173 [Lachnellula hyalina]TVY22952.1 hypothetical protein LHYA1_G008173 [Lachnellula hyalina]
MSSLSYDQTNALIWTLGGLAIVLTVGRLLIRLKLNKKLHWDDAAHVVALLCMILHSAIYTGGRSLAEAVLAYRAKKTHHVPDLKLYLRLNIVTAVFGFTCYWAVKLSFLLFYRMLFGVSKAFMKAWWGVSAYVLITFWVAIGTSLTQCGGSAFKITDPVACGSKQSEILDSKIFKICFAVNITSDLAIMALPLGMLSRLQIRAVQKLGIAVIFCLTFVIIALEIVRLVQSLKGTGQSWNVVWTNTETSVAVIVSCLPTYNTLFRYRERVNASKASSAYDRLAESKNTNKSQSTKGLSETPSTKSQNDSARDIPLEQYHSYNV